MLDVSEFKLASQLQPGETVCFCSRRTPSRHRVGLTIVPVFLLGLLIYTYMANASALDGSAVVTFLAVIAIFLAAYWRIPTGETIVTDLRVLSEINNQKSEVLLSDLERAFFLKGLMLRYCKTVSKDKSAHHFMLFFGSIQEFADCLPQQVAVYSSINKLKSGKECQLVSGFFALVGLFGGFALGFLSLYGSVEAFNGVTCNQFWSVVIVVTVLFGPPIGGFYFGSKIGICLAVAILRKNCSFEEAKETAQYGFGLDVDSPSGFLRFLSRRFTPFIERRLSKAFGQPVNLN